MGEAQRQDTYLTAEEYLVGEPFAETKHEYIDGESMPWRARLMHM